MSKKGLLQRMRDLEPERPGWLLTPFWMTIAYFLGWMLCTICAYYVEPRTLLFCGFGAAVILALIVLLSR